MSQDQEDTIPETRVLAISSHVVYGYVGNTMAALVMQSLGVEVAAINTVQYSKYSHSAAFVAVSNPDQGNHAGYNQFLGTRASVDEISNLFQGLRISHLNSFDMMLSGYLPNAAVVKQVGAIASELKVEGMISPGNFFWVLDPVMGDNGKLYVDEDVVSAYKAVLHDADLILPNQYEAEWLSGVKIVDMKTLTQAIEALHSTYGIPHIIITSVSLPSPASSSSPPSLSAVGSTMTPAGRSRIFKIGIPVLDCYFSGTGDMFAALMVVRLREAVSQVPGLDEMEAWQSLDGVEAVDLPLAKAAEKVLASMHEVLTRTKKSRDEALEFTQMGLFDMNYQQFDDDKEMHLLKTRAAEVRLVRNLDCLRNPRSIFQAEKVE